MKTTNHLDSRADDFFHALGVVVADHADLDAAHGARATLAFANAYCIRLYGAAIPDDRYRVVLASFRANLAARRAAAADR